MNQTIDLEHRLVSHNTSNVKKTVNEEQMLSQIEELLKRATNAEIRMREKQDELEDYKSRHGNYISDIQTAEQTITALQLEIESLNKRRIEDEKTITALKSDIGSLQIGTRKGMLENDELRRESAEMRGNTEIRKVQVDQLKAEVMELKQRTQDLNHQKVSLMKNQEVVDKDVARIGNELVEIRGALSREGADQEVALAMVERLITNIKATGPKFFAQGQALPRKAVAERSSMFPGANDSHNYESPDPVRAHP